MHHTGTRVLLLTALVPVAMVVAMLAALSSSEEADRLRERDRLNTYLHRFAAAVDESSERTAPLNQEFDPRQGQRSAILDELISTLEALSPPEDTVSPHEEFVSALYAFRDIDQELTRKAQDVEYGPEMVDLIRTVFSGPRAELIQRRFNTACANLQQLAEGDGIAVDLECQGDTEEDAQVVRACLDLNETPVDGRIRPHASCDEDIPAIEDLCSSELGPYAPVVPSGAPDPPPGMVPASELHLVEDGQDDLGTLCIPLYGDYEEDDIVAFYTFDGGAWSQVGRVQLRQGGEFAEVEFDEPLENFAAFKPLKDLD
jgi:hypothetical protein